MVEDLITHHRRRAERPGGCRSAAPAARRRHRRRPALRPPATPAAPAPIDLAPPSVTEVDTASAGPRVDRSIFRSPWFWGAVGAVLVAGVAGTVYGLSRGPVLHRPIAA